MGTKPLSQNENHKMRKEECVRVIPGKSGSAGKGVLNAGAGGAVANGIGLPVGVVGTAQIACTFATSVIVSGYYLVMTNLRLQICSETHVK
ncbi:hypothetical protein AVEN_79635-1 [Araneus ventricosus]|uniref:Uncharacterized protein n=1 Tax=Araneus ventricosus TaxID=182803 RepID=A0A4Y2G3Y6_ARAVE|nr:hypothetical protein AVEN_79635-1 [Araneus ventricosus]